MAKFKVKVSGNTNESDLQKIKEYNIIKANAYFRCRPFVTKVYIAMQLRMPYTFVSDNWELISKLD